MRRLSVRSTYVLAFLVAASYAFFALRVPRGVKSLSERRQQIEQLEKRNALLEQEIERKQEHVRRLSSNPGEQELDQAPLVAEPWDVAADPDAIDRAEPQGDVLSQYVGDRPHGDLLSDRWTRSAEVCVVEAGSYGDGEGRTTARPSPRLA